MHRLRLFIPILLAACAPARAQIGHITRSCVPDSTTPSPNRPIDLRLAGTFRLAQIWTEMAAEHLADSVSYSSLQLTITDSAQRAAATRPSLGLMRRRDLQFVGSVRAGIGQRAEPAEVDAGVLYLGCRDCTDASPEVLRITGVSELGFSGTWRDYQTGIGVLIDTRTGQRSPDPAGYFCAWRE